VLAEEAEVEAVLAPARPLRPAGPAQVLADERFARPWAWEVEQVEGAEPPAVAEVGLR